MSGTGDLGVSDRRVRLYSPGDQRRYLEESAPASGARSEYRRDYARVIHSPSFRRLQGKTQLFPGHESDFFRNRLTHSLEVAQIAESIALILNEKSDYFREQNIDARLCSTAALLHDIGHPPFGHNGEEALDEAMREYGGFEGNAQTLRIVTQLEKKRRKVEVDNLIDKRCGLNLTYRVLASVLKYDNEIAVKRDGKSSVVKGYYAEDAPIVRDIKENVAPGWPQSGKFKTLECSIMDLADDISYSTYDLEDSFKAGFLNPRIILQSQRDLLERVAGKVAKETGDSNFDAFSVLQIFSDMFGVSLGEESFRRIGKAIEANHEPSIIAAAIGIIEQLDSVAEDGYLRTSFTSALVQEFIESVEVNFNQDFPQLSTVCVSAETKKKIETLKQYTYEATIASSRVRLTEFRGKEVVAGLFEALSSKRGTQLLPADVLSLYHSAGTEQRAYRVVADFIAGMTDRYALEFYGRLYSENPQTIFKPI